MQRLCVLFWFSCMLRENGFSSSFALRFQSNSLPSLHRKSCRELKLQTMILPLAIMLPISLLVCDSDVLL